MSHPNADKNYKIVNKQHEKAADQVFGVRNGVISGYTEAAYNAYQTWSFINVGQNLFHIKNKNTGDYAYVHSILPGVPISGSAQEYTWYLNTLDPNVTYRIETPDQKYVWILENSANYVTVVLKPAAGNKDKDEAKWSLKIV